MSEIGSCLDDHGVKDGHDAEAYDHALELWERVLELEEGFWPVLSLQDVTSTVEVV